MKLFLYPYTYKNSFLLFYSDADDQNAITGVFTHERFKYDKDLLDGLGIPVFQTLEMDVYLDLCEGVIVCPDEITCSSGLRPLFLRQMQTCLEHQKNVFCSMRLEQEEVEQFLSIASEYDSQFLYLLNGPAETQRLESSADPLDECNVPIMYIGELCEQAGAKNLTAGLSAQLKQHGYRVCTVLDDCCAGLLGMHQTPFFLKEGIPEWEKVVRLNRYMKKLEREVQPDLFLVQVPGSVYRYSKKIFSEFGIYFFYFSQAFIPDLFFCAVPDNLCQEDIIKTVHKKTQASYGYGLDGVCKSRLYLDPLAAFHYGYADYRFLEHSREEEKLQCGVPVVQEGGQKCYEKFYGIIEETLGRESVEIL